MGLEDLQFSYDLQISRWRLVTRRLSIKVFHLCLCSKTRFKNSPCGRSNGACPQAPCNDPLAGNRRVPINQDVQGVYLFHARLNRSHMRHWFDFKDCWINKNFLHGCRKIPSQKDESSRLRLRRQSENKKSTLPSRPRKYDAKNQFLTFVIRTAAFDTRV